MQFNSITKLRQNSEGDVSYKSKSSLKYEYELETSDGTYVKLNAQLRLSQSYKKNADSTSIKSRAKLELSFVQQGVEDGARELIGAGGDQTAIELSIQSFRSAIGEASGTFLQSDTLDGDELIGRVVDAFNDFSGALNSLLFGQDEPVHDTITDTEAPIRAATPTSQVVPAIPEVATSPVDESLLSQLDDASPVEETSPPAEEKIVDRPIADPESVSIRQSIMFKMRFKFTQSMSSVINSFDSHDSDEGNEVNTRRTSQFKLRVDGAVNSFLRYQGPEDERVLPQLIDHSA